MQEAAYDLPIGQVVEQIRVGEEAGKRKARVCSRRFCGLAEGS